ncbi:hypothetical protein KW782_03480 [Candidatus Parcubacteria bacterium]|nr:hypothetical protein [Candidatus Parcubacteria bacterium]
MSQTLEEHLRVLAEELQTQVDDWLRQKNLLKPGQTITISLTLKEERPVHVVIDDQSAKPLIGDINFGGRAFDGVYGYFKDRGKSAEEVYSMSLRELAKADPNHVRAQKFCGHTGFMEILRVLSVHNLLEGQWAELAKFHKI